jgi:hypothetical protein
MHCPYSFVSLFVSLCLYLQLAFWYLLPLSYHCVLDLPGAAWTGRLGRKFAALGASPTQNEVC